MLLSQLRNSITAQNYIEKNDYVEIYWSSKSSRTPFARGLVREIATKKIIMRGCPYPTDIVCNNKFDINHYKIDYDTSEFYKSKEGTIILVYYCNGWNTSTNRRLDAFNGYWACPEKRYGKSFSQCLRNVYEDDPNIVDDKEYAESIYEKYFDKNKRYVFLLPPEHEERVVWKTDRRIPYHLQTWDENLEPTGELLHEKMTPEKLDIKSKEDFLMELGKIDWRESQGIIMIDSQGRHTKFQDPEYQRRFDHRQNIPNLKLAYLYSRGSPYDTNLFLSIYPEFIPIATQMEEDLRNCFKIITKIILSPEAFSRKNAMTEFAKKILNPTEMDLKVCAIWNPNLTNKVLNEYNKKYSKKS